jgi:NAD(P)-dependent dehydrogenase (short-subunit alcohol dehydrogenase family)
MTEGRFAGLQALVVGGAGGIGRATCARLARGGAAVLATGSTQSEISAFTDEAHSIGVATAVLDVRDSSGVVSLVSSLERLDVLVNLAGVGRGRDEDTDTGFMRTVDVNLHGTMRTCYAARGLLKERGGSIVNAASMMSFFGSATAPAYSASKGGVVQLTKSLAIALGPAGIRVNAVAPGWIETPMTATMFAEPAVVERVLQRTPLGRLGTPTDVAEAICFLADPRSSFITGTVLPIDGGYLAA